MSIPKVVVPGYPYEGGFYWMLGEPTTRHSHGHRYYAGLYGAAPDQFVPKAGALLSLFDRIELASADHALPDSHRYVSGDTYFHPDLRLSVSRKENEWTEEADALAEYALANGLLKEQFLGNALLESDQFTQRHFISRLVLQVRLAIQFNALLVGDELFQEAYRRLSPHIKQFVHDIPSQLPDSLTLQITERTLRVAGLNFSPASFDEFAAIRGSSEITKYAASFREAIDTARSSADLDEELLRLMKEAMHSAAISKHVQSTFQTTGSIATIVGAIPVVGTAATLLGLSADMAGRKAERHLKDKNWYLLGPKMKEIAIEEMLRKP